MAEGTFVRVACDCGAKDVWLKCDQCGRRSLFHMGAERVSCECGANYDHAVCVCSKPVAVSSLVAVPFDKGPVSFDEVEIAWGRVVVGVLIVGGLVAAGVFALM